MPDVLGVLELGDCEARAANAVDGRDVGERIACRFGPDGQSYTFRHPRATVSLDKKRPVDVMAGGVTPVGDTIALGRAHDTVERGTARVVA